MTLQDLKNSDKSLSEKASELVKSLGIDENTAVNAVSLKKGDKFKITGMNKVGTATESFQPMVFTTSTGAQIGTKHFASVDMDADDAPALGRTAIEVAGFCAYCVENDIEFSVKKIEVGEPRDVPNGKAGETYTPKTFTLAVE